MRLADAQFAARISVHYNPVDRRSDWSACFKPELGRPRVRRRPLSERRALTERREKEAAQFFDGKYGSARDHDLWPVKALYTPNWSKPQHLNVRRCSRRVAVTFWDFADAVRPHSRRACCRRRCLLAHRRRSRAHRAQPELAKDDCSIRWRRRRRAGLVGLAMASWFTTRKANASRRRGETVMR